MPAGELAQVETRIRSINATAVIHRTQRCEVELDTVLGRRAFDLERILAIEPDFLSEDDHEHDDAVKSVCLRTDRPLDGTRLTGWLQGLLVERGQDFLRTKGILSIAGQDKQYVVQAVHMLMEGNFTKPWSPNENGRVAWSSSGETSMSWNYVSSSTPASHEFVRRTEPGVLLDRVGTAQTLDAYVVGLGFLEEGLLAAALGDGRVAFINGESASPPSFRFGA